MLFAIGPLLKVQDCTWRILLFTYLQMPAGYRLGTIRGGEEKHALGMMALCVFYQTLGFIRTSEE